MSTSDPTIRSVITPNEQALRKVFHIPKPYFIDIYQREYRWSKENVETLLNDIEVRFEQHKRTKADPKQIQEEVQSHFDPYFLNTYLTHESGGAISVVDGQQRLTTVLLMLIKLQAILKNIEEDTTYEGKTISSKVLRDLIFESDDFGDASRFKIYNANREQAFRALMDGSQLGAKDETQQRIRDNYEVISDYYETYLALPGSPVRYDIEKVTYYITYLLDRISIVEIKIERQQNVPMIFEVVNDRGLGLKPYEILKGKLLGTLPAQEKEKANEIWTALQNNYYRMSSSDSSLDLDAFFRLFFRAKFADTETEYESFEGDYHYQVYRNKKIRDYFRDFKDPARLYELITKDIRYFAETYLWLRSTYEDEFVFYNRLLDQNQQYLLVISALEPNDPYQSAKITAIAKKFDQLHSTVRLLDIYESNTFQRLIYPLVREIRGKTIGECEAAFGATLIKHIESEELVLTEGISSVEQLFTRERFETVRHRWPNFSKYVLMRIDRNLSALLEKPSYAGGNLEELERHFNKNTNRRFGMHLEHIYAYNESNMSLFANAEGEFDSQQFQFSRNLLGMVLLLKDKQNLSSGNEIYKDKVETYKKSNFIWNELLSGHLHSVDMRNVPDELKNALVEPDPSGAFPKDKILSRQHLMFSAIKRIWCDAV